MIILQNLKLIIISYYDNYIIFIFYDYNLIFMYFLN